MTPQLWPITDLSSGPNGKAAEGLNLDPDVESQPCADPYHAPSLVQHVAATTARGFTDLIPKLTKS